MRKFILAMALAAMSCGLLNAETIAEGKALHPTATFYYCKEKKWDGIPKMSSVERFAWKGLDVWIKFYDQDDEMSSRLNGHVETEGDWTIIPFKSGKVAVNFQEEKLVYFGASGDILGVFDIDIKKSVEAIKYGL